MFFSTTHTARTYGLYLVNVTPENSWYESLQTLLRQPTQFFQQNAIRIVSDKVNSRYRVRFKPMRDPVSWPDQDTSTLLGEALGPDRFIRSHDHPLYRELIEGVELD